LRQEMRLVPSRLSGKCRAKYQGQSYSRARHEELPHTNSSVKRNLSTFLLLFRIDSHGSKQRLQPPAAISSAHLFDRSSKVVLTVRTVVIPSQTAQNHFPAKRDLPVCFQSQNAYYRASLVPAET
jgi:hypothetical protein